MFYAHNAGDNDENREPLALRRDGLIDAIEAVPAISVDGLKVKAQAIKSIYPDRQAFELGAASTTDMRLAVQIVEGLAATGPGASNAI